jgi:hypothetical protein
MTGRKPHVQIVVESMFGNTRAVAEAVQDGLSQYADTNLVGVSEATVDVGDDIDLLVVGGPTHAFGMTRQNTRAEAVRQGAAAETAAIGIREWISTLPRRTDRRLAATFDTKIAKGRWLPGAAARSAAKRLADKGYRARDMQTFYVLDTRGPLAESELERACDWGSRLGAAVVVSTKPSRQKL